MYYVSNIYYLLVCLWHLSLWRNVRSLLHLLSLGWRAHVCRAAAARARNLTNYITYVCMCVYISPLFLLLLRTFLTYKKAPTSIHTCIIYVHTDDDDDTRTSMKLRATAVHWLDIYRYTSTISPAAAGPLVMIYLSLREEICTHTRARSRAQLECPARAPHCTENYNIQIFWPPSRYIIIYNSPPPPPTTIIITTVGVCIRMYRIYKVQCVRESARREATRAVSGRQSGSK